MHRSLLLLVVLAVLHGWTSTSADDRCHDRERLTVRAPDGRKFDPATGRDTRQYPPDPQVDFTHLKLDLRMPDPGSRSFTGTQTLTFATLGRPIARLKLDAVDLDVKSVTDAKGNRLDFNTRDDHLIIHFPEALPPQTTSGLIIAYACTEPTDGMIFALPDEGYPDRPLMIHTQGQTETNRHWFAAHDYPNERCTSELIVTIPSKYKVLGNGKLVGKADAGDGLTRWHYKLDQPHVSYLVSLVVGEFEVVSETWRGIPVEYWVPPTQRSGAMRTFGRTPKMLDLFSRLTGADYPYAKYAQAVVYLFAAGGMENTTLTTLHEQSVLDERAAIDQDLEGLIAHELAHQWYGDMITCNSWPHIWLNEGFATYFEALWYEHDRGKDEYDDEIWQTMRSVAEEAAPDPRGGMVFFHYDNAWETFGRGGGNNPYPKGATVLHMLRQSLGDELFFRCIAEYTRRYAWRQVESDDLRRVTEELSGRSYERFFQQWIYRSGAPHVKVAYEWDDAQKTARITLEQTQEITADAPAFVADVHVWVVDAHGAVTKHLIPLDRRTATGAFPCEREPKQVAIDPINAVLMKVDLEDVPTALLLEQARRGPTTMSRYSAIAGLAKRDRAAVRDGLREILFDENTFHGLRSEAANSLGKMQADAARAILLDALADGRALPHHKVRRATVAALGQYRHPRAAETLVRIARGDESSAVEAEAARALGRQDASDDVIDALLDCATRTSYRDQIRTAAVEALGNLGDARGIEPAMQLATYGQPFRSRPTGCEALGKISRALDEPQRRRIRAFLVPLMRDPQERTARAAITALGASGDEQAIDDLRKVIDSAASEDLRIAAQGAIDAIRGKEESAAVRALRERVEALEKDRRGRDEPLTGDDTPELAPTTAPTP